MNSPYSLPKKKGVNTLVPVAPSLTPHPPRWKRISLTLLPSIIVTMITLTMTRSQMGVLLPKFLEEFGEQGGMLPEFLQLGEVLPNFSEGTGDYTNSAIGGNANAVENSRITGRNTTKISLAWSSAVEISGEAGGITAKNPGVAAENSRSAGRNAAKVSEGAEGGVADNP